MLADGDVATAEDAAPPSADAAPPKKRQKGPPAAAVHLSLSLDVLGGAGGAAQDDGAAGETARCPRLALRSRAWPRWSDLS